MMNQRADGFPEIVAVSVGAFTSKFTVAPSREEIPSRGLPNVRRLCSCERNILEFPPDLHIPVLFELSAPEAI